MPANLRGECKAKLVTTAAGEGAGAAAPATCATSAVSLVTTLPAADDGLKSRTYCGFCLKNGAFIDHCPTSKMLEVAVSHLLDESAFEEGTVNAPQTPPQILRRWDREQPIG
ncbi:MAG: hypothetical protein LBB42_02410 [Coriobacteriales bacterium]|nr:hypothetical protein [Coriobacteriales bacterium]